MTTDWKCQTAHTSASTTGGYAWVRGTQNSCWLIDVTMLADLVDEANGDIIDQLNVVGDQMLEVMNHLEFGDVRIIHGGFDDEIEDGAG